MHFKWFLVKSFHERALDPLTRLLCDVILPNLKLVQTSQAEQIAANDRLETAIEELRLHLESQFATLRPSSRPAGPSWPRRRQC